MKKQANRLPIGWALSIAVALVGAGCAHPPRPAVMADADHTRRTPAAQQAEKLAPQAFAHAEKLRKQAEEAYEAEDYVGAQLLSERALAAYQRAHAQARLVRATNLAEEASQNLREAEERLAHNEGELARVKAEADALEARIQVARDALPITPSSTTSDYKRELARLASARALALDARLLCTAAKLLGGQAAGLDEAEKLVTDLDSKIKDPKARAPIDEASRARALCLATLTAVRRGAFAESSLGHADALLAALSASSSLEPARDDRGVVVTLRNVFQGSSLSNEAKARLQELGRLATEHPSFPLQVVVHTASEPRPGDLARYQAQGAEVAKALAAAGAPEGKIHVETAGASRPVVDPSSARDRLRNERIEIVFVNPGG